MKTRSYKRIISIVLSVTVVCSLLIGTNIIYSHADGGLYPTSLILGKLPADYYIAQSSTPGTKYIDPATNKPIFAYYQRDAWPKDDLSILTDGFFMTAGGFAGATSTDMNYVLVYDLGVTSNVNSIYVLCNEYETHYVGGEDFYVGDDVSTLFNQSNRVYTSANNIKTPKNKITLPSVAHGRYVAIVITKADVLGSLVARVQEVAVMGSQVSITDKPQDDTIVLGDNVTLTASPKGDFAAGTVNQWSSSNPDIATINKDTGLLNTLKAGTTTISVNRGAATDSFVLDVIVAKLATGISIKSNPLKTNYIQGQYLNLAGGVITVNYSNANPEDLPITYDMVSGYNKDQTGNQTITVKYGNKATNFTVTVTSTQAVPTNLVLNKLPVMYSTKADALSTMKGSINYASGGQPISCVTDGDSTSVFNGTWNGVCCLQTSSDMNTYVLIYDLGQASIVDEIRVFSSSEKARYISGMSFYIGNDKQTLFDASHLSYTSGAALLTGYVNDVDITNNKTGRYVAVVITNPDVSGSAAARLAEIAVYGQKDPNAPTETPNYVTYTGDSVVDETFVSNLGTSLIANCSVNNSKLATDGIINGVNYFDAQDNCISYGLNKTVVFDMNANASVSDILVASYSGNNKNNLLNDYEVYVGSSPSTLFESQNRVLGYINDKKDICQVFKLNSPAHGRYVGIRVNAVYTDTTVRLAEIAVYGEVDQFQPSNLVKSKLPVSCYIADKGIPAVSKGNAASQSQLMILTNGNNNESSGQSCNIHLNSLKQDIVMIYYLGGTAKLDNIVFYSSNEPGYFVGGMDFYYGNSLTDLFDKSNQVYTSGNADITTRSVGVDLTNKTGRYIAVVVTRPYASTVQGYGLARIAEIEANGILLQQDPIREDPTFTDANSGITATISTLNPDDNFDKVKSFRVVKSDVPAGLSDSIESSQMKAVSDLYTLQFIDESNQIITDDSILGDRHITIYIPSNDNEFKFIGSQLNDGFEIVPNSIIKGSNTEGVIYSFSGSYIVLSFKSILTSDQYSIYQETQGVDGNIPSTGDKQHTKLILGLFIISIISVAVLARKKFVYKK